MKTFKHILKLVAISAVALPSLSTPIASAQFSSGYVTLYEHCNYQGKAVTLPIGNYDYNTMLNRGVKNDDVSSVKLSGDAKVTLYQDAGYRGRSVTTDLNISCLVDKQFNDQLSSLIVSAEPKTIYSPPPTRPTTPQPSSSPRGSVTLYQHCNYQGKAVTLSAGSYDYNTMVRRGIKNDDVSSVKVSGGAKATLYQDAGYRGRSVTVDRNISCLVDKQFNDQLSSLKVSSEARGVPSRPVTQSPPPNPRPSSSNRGSVTLYEHCNYQGKAVTLSAGTYDYNSILSRGIKNDDVSSVKVSGGAKATLYQDAGYRGRSVTVDRNISCLVDKQFNDQLSSLRVSSGSNTVRNQTVTRPFSSPSPSPSPSPFASHNTSYSKGNMVCSCTAEYCGNGAVGANAGDVFSDLSRAEVNDIYTPHSNTGWTCAIPSDISRGSGDLACYCKGYCGNGGRGADPKTMVLGTKPSQLSKFYGGGKKGNRTGWVCGTWRNK